LPRRPRPFGHHAHERGRAERLNRGWTYEERAGADARGLSLVDWLAARWEHSDRETWEARVAAGEVLVNGAPPSGPLRAGDLVAWRRPPWEEPAVPTDFAVLFEDPDLVVVSKPSGLPTAPAGGFLEHTLLHLVRRDRPEAAPMHRLGRATSGVVVFAKTAEARSALQSAWRSREVGKVYRALVVGQPADARFTITTPIGPVPHAKLGTVHAATPDGKPATSHVRVLRGGEQSLVEVVIETGRPHQIRIHLASVGHPLVGDPLYLPGGLPSPDAVPGDGGYLLHAHTVTLRHPRTGAVVTFTAEPPPSLR
jgi:23S rRNA pseudouridine1911/1915/1917 synthase